MPAEVTHARADNELPTVSKEKYTNNKNAQNNIDTKSQGSAASKGSQKKNWDFYIFESNHLELNYILSDAYN